MCLISHYSNSNRKSNNRGVDKRFESVIPFMKHRCANIGGTLQLFLQASFVPLQCSREMIYLRINLIPVVKAVKNRTCSFRSHANLPATLPDALSRMTTIHDTHRLFFLETKYGNLIFLGKQLRFTRGNDEDVWENMYGDACGILTGKGKFCYTLVSRFPWVSME